MANVLEFALGLQTSEFLSSLGVAGGELLSFAGIAETVRMGVEKLEDAINEGAALKAMSSATGESVSKLYQLQHGLEAIGASGDVSMLLMRMQNALSGVNEEGVRTNVIFARLGLDLGELRKAGPADALLQISQAMSRLNASQMAGVGEQLFGRFGAQTVEQMARNAALFNREMSESSQTGALLDKFAATFEGVKADWGDIENDVLGIWVTIAGNIAPALEKLFGGIHDRIKEIGPAIAGALQSGNIETLLWDALSAVLEQGGFYGERIFEALATGFGDAVYAALKLAIEEVVPMWWNGIMHAGRIALDQGAIKVLQAENAVHEADLNTPGATDQYKAKVRGQILANDQGITNLAQMIDSEMGEDAADFRGKMSDAMKTLSESIQGGIADVIKDWQASGVNAPHAMLDKLKADIAKFAAIGTATAGGSGAGGGANESIMGLESHSRPEFTSLEKMGFIMSGSRVQNPYELRKVDLLQQIAHNTSPSRGGGGHAPNSPGGMGDFPINPLAHNMV